MRVRGIFKPEKLVSLASPEAIWGAIRWYDEQRERSDSISPGVLANAISDGGMPGYGLAPEAPPCPCTPDLEAEWRTVLERFGDDYALMWAGKCHPHRHDAAGWTFGADAWVLGWIGKYLPVIRRELGEQVHIVKCDNHHEEGRQP